MLPIPPRLSRALITAVALSLLGSCLSVLVAAPASAAVAPLDLVVTEVAPDNTGNDDYEYFEVHNLSAVPVDLASHVSLAYVTTTLTVASVEPGGTADTVLPPGATAVLWVSYTNATVNSHARTEKQFRDFWAAAAPAANPTDYRLLRVTGQAGMANGGDRTLRMVDPSGLDISRSSYTVGSAGPNQTVHFRLPATGSVDLVEHQRLAIPTPGNVAPEQLVQGTPPGEPAVPDQDPPPAPDPTLDAAQLQLTELVVDSTNVGTADGYEFVEIYNGANRAADFRDYTLQYLHSSDGQVNTAVVPWPSQPADPVVQPGHTLVFWIKNGQNDHLTSADFNAHYNADLVAGQDLVEIFSAGMANSSGRGMEIRSNTGHMLNKGYYNVSGVDDVDPDQGIQYAYDRANPRRQVLTGKATATPGYAAPAQVPGGLVVAPTDTSPPAVSDLTDEIADPSADLAFQFRIDDDVRALTATLSIWNDVDGTPRRVNLLRSPADDYNYKLPAVDLLGKRWLEYSVTARDGVNEVTTPVRRLVVDATEPAPVRLNVTDGQFVSGTQRLAAAGESGPTAMSLTIDGEPVTSPAASLEREPYFAFEAAGVDTFFRNGVLLGEDVLRIFDDGIYEGFETISLPVPLDAITQGEPVTLSVYAGTKAAPEVSVENNDDFTIWNVRLVLPDGRALAPAGYADPTKVLQLGDSAGKLDFFDAVFTVPDDAFTAVAGRWDTTAAADGEHRVTASNGTNSLSRIVTVDNTAPTVVTDLVDGQKYRGPFVIEATATDDGSGVASLSATLDGYSVELPYATSSTELSSGAHKAIVTAVDAMGNLTTRTISFTTPDEQPRTELLSPPDGAIAERTDRVTLKALGTDPEGDVLDVAFREGYRLEPDDTGVRSRAGTTRVAATLDRSGSVAVTPEELASITTTDGLSAEVASDSEFPYNLFEVDVPGGAGDGFSARISWAGEANAEAKILLYVRNHMTGAWEEVDRHITGTTREKFELGAVVPAAQRVADGRITVLVQHSEGFAGRDLTTRQSDVTPYHPGASPRASYDFTVGWESDTQYYNETPEYYKHQVGIHDFVLEQRDELNLQYLMHTGDVVNEYADDRQWQRAAPQYRRLDVAGLPYGVLAGNHDVGHKEVDYTNFSSYFGERRYAPNPWYGGSHKDNRGHYDLITAGGVDLLFLSMGWAPGDEEIRWMNQIIRRYPERKVVVELHEYMLTTGGLGPIPRRIYDEVVAPNPNVIAVASGHYHDAYTRTDEFDDDRDGTPDRTVYSMLFDYQGLPEGGLGYLRLLHFDNQAGQIVVRTYSPTRDDFDADDPSLEMQHQEFKIPYAAGGIVSRTKVLATDSFAVEILTGREIKRFRDVASGSEVTALWKELPAGEHGWYVHTADPYGATHDTAVRTFSTIPKDTSVTSSSARQQG